MKKPARKLVLSRETLRTLHTVDLVHVAGGVVVDTNDGRGCVVVNVVEAK